MRKRFMLVFFAFSILFISHDINGKPHYLDEECYLEFRNYVMSIYNKLNLNELIDYEVIEYAMRGYFIIKREGLINKKNILSIIDYTRPSTTKRLFVIDVDNRKLLFYTYVSHGKNSGVLYPIYFSNKISTMKSCIGFFVTGDTYNGLHGYSLRLRGLEDGFNDNAERRKIVMHGGNYVSQNFINKHGRLGRSWGCPVVPSKLTRNIINTVKDGTCLFIYHNSKEYIENSSYLDRNEAVSEYLKGS